MATPLTMPSTLEIHGESQPKRKSSYSAVPSLKTTFAATNPRTMVQAGGDPGGKIQLPRGIIAHFSDGGIAQAQQAAQQADASQQSPGK